MVAPMPKTKAEKIDYGFVKLPEDLIAETDRIVGTHGYRSRSEVIKDALRRLLASYGIPERPIERLRHYNIDEHGVRVLDLDLDPPNGRIVDVYFRPDAHDRVQARCEYDETDRCRHIDFALNLPQVREIFKQRGWKAP